MTTYKSAHTSFKAKVRGLCLVLLLCFHLGVGDVPGPCRYSMRKDHLATVRHLIENQLQNGCSIIYMFTERGRLSNMCYVKAALPNILELIDAHFRYARSSDNGHYVEAVKALIHNLYSQKCIAPIDEELEDDPAKFSKVHRGSPREALDRVQEVLSLYLELLSTNNTPVDWNCEDEYAQNESEFTTPPAQTTDAGAECQCFNRAVDYGQSEQVSVTDRSLWKHLSQPTATTPILPESTGWAPLFSGTQDPTDGQQKMAVTDSRVTSGVGKENDQTDGVVSPSATSPLLRAVHTDSSLLPGRSSEASVKMGAFPAVMGTPPFSTESHTTSVFPDAPVSTDDTPFPDTGVTDLFVGPTDSGGEDNLSRTTTAFSRGPKQSKGFTTDSLTDYVSFGPHVTAISSQVNAGRPATPAPLQEVQVERTHKMAEASAIVPLAKRSVDPRLDGSHLDPLADSPSPQRGTTTKSQLLPAMEAPIGTISNRSPNLQHRTPSSEITDEKVVSPDPQDPRKHFQSGGPGTSHDSHTAAFVMAPVCGGLLLLPALYWLRRQKKLQDLLQRSQMTETQRLNPQSTDLEMQDGETMVQACMPSPYSGQL